VFKNGVPRGTVEWRQGKKWVAVPPPYDKQYYLDNPLPETYKFATGKGSARKTLQVLHGLPPEDVDLDMGWAKVHISSQDGTLSMDFAGGKEAVEERWEEERQQDSEIEAKVRAYRESLTKEEEESLEGEPESETERIPQPLTLDRELLPEYSTDNLKVYAVNMAYIRNKYANKSVGDRLGVDVTGGGHHFVYWKIIPENEVWIDRTLLLDKTDAGGYVLHEIEEREKMKNGMEYSEAHNDHANKVEIEARLNPDEMDDMIEERLKSYEKPVRKVYNKRKSKVAEEEEPQLPSKYYLGRRLRGSSLGISL
jgi:hypothetical protein